ncbi:FAD-dependent oxidoreductase [Mycolicibacterium goodii]|nr:FAD-dependent oxidoreductase [Mycolicibacterium goodii]MBU8811796.1 FAD-dependent oxidoreductase [Mycolicibacterium goodii]MBU8814700.1 FAD-dependent oxidoreductase [Mycolicibacterium goodii]ULN50080.1 FAD-dependent oxidoreductase [Mycolicibacterium goodii]
MMTECGTLIIGASQAGLQIAVSLREAGDTAPITLVGEEAHAPYQRPPLSKAYLLGGTDLEKLWLRTPEFLAQRDISLVTGERIDSLELHGVGPSGTAHTIGGRRLTFDRLALTVGARPRRLEAPGADLDGVTYLRTADDAALLRELQSDAESVVVVGGGFIGLEAAAVARAQGKRVTVVEAADRLIGRAVAPVVSEFYRAAHARRGVDVRTDARVTWLAGRNGHVQAVELSDGTWIPADLVIVGIGVVPRTKLARQLGLECDGGIVVDRCARTSNHHVVAAGDCTVQPHPLTGTGRVRIESVQNAVSQAKAAAASLAGRREPSDAVPWFWSDQYELKLQIAGLSTGHDHHVVRGDLDGESFSVLYYREERLVAVDAVNAPGDYMAVRKALTQGATIAAAAAADSSVPLRELILPQAVGA